MGKWFVKMLKENVKDIYGIDTTAPAESTPIACPKCGHNTVKPTTVLYGRSLPSEFFELKQQDLPEVDLLIIAGTSLTVGPANTVALDAEEDTIRMLINQDDAPARAIGMQLDSGPRTDILAAGDADEIFLQLAQELGWVSQLQALSG